MRSSAVVADFNGVVIEPPIKTALPTGTLCARSAASARCPRFAMDI